MSGTWNAEQRKNMGGNEPLIALRDEAFARYGVRCLWNMAPSATPAGMKLIAEQLCKYGDMDAWRLASRITRALKDAA